PSFVTGGNTFVEGRTEPGAQVFINAVNIPVESDGRFHARVGIGNEWRTISIAAFADKKPGRTEMVIRRDLDALTRQDLDFIDGHPDTTDTTVTISTTAR